MTRIVYPRGMGGHWLSNLIWHLENQCWDLPQVNTVFDGSQRGSIPVSHAYEIPDPSQPNQRTHYASTGCDLLFSSSALFVHYLNNAVKVKYHFHGVDQLDFRPQLFELSNGAYYYFTDQYYQDYYCQPPDLDHSRIFVNPDQFANDLFALLNKLNLRYTANTEYVLASQAYYRSTCPTPSDHYGNVDSILWLACCHAVTRMDQIDIPELITDFESAQRLLQPWSAYCEDRVRPFIFEQK